VKGIFYAPKLKGELKKQEHTDFTVAPISDPKKNVKSVQRRVVHNSNDFTICPHDSATNRNNNINKDSAAIQTQM